MGYEFFNFILLILIIVIIIIVFVIIIGYYYTIRSYVVDIANKAKGLIPKLHSDDNMEIIYDSVIPSSCEYNNLFNKDFDEDLALFLASLTRSAYNLSRKTKSYLPDYIELIDSIGPNGYLLKLKNYDEKNNIYILTYRGTNSIDDLCTDIDSVQTEYVGLNKKMDKRIKIHRGFYTYWNESKEELTNLNTRIDKDDVLIITGHSLGCSSAALSALALSNYLSNVHIKLYMFAPPRLGNNNFIKELDNHVSDNWAIINSSDIIPELPPVTLPTIGNNWIYDNWSNKILIDIQYGSILLNHKLTTYICGFNIDDDICPHELPKWNRDYIKIIKPSEKS